MIAYSLPDSGDSGNRTKPTLCNRDIFVVERTSDSVPQEFFEQARALSDFEGAPAYGRELRRAWSEMDIAELASALDIGRTFAQAASFLCRGRERGTTEREGAWTGRALRHARPGRSIGGVRIRHILRMTPRRP